MKCLIIGGNRFVGLRLSHLLAVMPGTELHVLNRTGQVAHCKKAIVYKGDHLDMASAGVDREWDVVIDFACFDAKQAQSSLDHFKRVGRYVFISTASVYDGGASLVETAFDASQLDLSIPLPRDANAGVVYQYGKRQAEAVFAQRSPFPTLSVRFPFLLGPDDYTRRLEFHVERAREGRAIYVPSIEARFSVLHSQDAALFLQWATKQNLSGALNVACSTPLTLRELIAQIHLVHGLEVRVASEEIDDNRSPYGPTTDWFMNTQRLNATGWKARPFAEWLPELLGPCAVSSASSSGYVH